MQIRSIAKILKPGRCIFLVECLLCEGLKKICLKGDPRGTLVNLGCFLKMLSCLVVK